MQTKELSLKEIFCLMCSQKLCNCNKTFSGNNIENKIPKKHRRHQGDKPIPLKSHGNDNELVGQRDRHLVKKQNKRRQPPAVFVKVFRAGVFVFKSFSVYILPAQFDKNENGDINNKHSKSDGADYHPFIKAQIGKEGKKSHHGNLNYGIERVGHGNHKDAQIPKLVGKKLDKFVFHRDFAGPQSQQYQNRDKYYFNCRFPKFVHYPKIIAKNSPKGENTWRLNLQVTWERNTQVAKSNGPCHNFADVGGAVQMLKNKAFGLFFLNQPMRNKLPNFTIFFDL